MKTLSWLATLSSGFILGKSYAEMPVGAHPAVFIVAGIVAVATVAGLVAEWLGCE